jgi:hypothetical protein
VNVSGNGYSIFQSSAFSYTPNNIGLSLGYNRSGGNGESSIVWGAPASGFNFEIASVTSNVITPRMTITTSGNVGIGTTSPDDYGAGYKMLSINASTAGILQLRSNNAPIINIVGTSTSADFEAFTDKSISFKTGILSVATRLFITTSGNVLIGTATSGASRLRIVGLPTSAAGLSSGDIWNDGGTLKIA